VHGILGSAHGKLKRLNNQNGANEASVILFKWCLHFYFVGFETVGWGCCAGGCQNVKLTSDAKNALWAVALIASGVCKVSDSVFG